MGVYYRRRLPHLHELGQPLFLTWRLSGSLPAGRVFPVKMESGKAFVAMDRLLDCAATGSTHLRRPDIAELVVNAIHHGETHLGQYELHAYLVMANHVHLLITPRVQPVKLTQTLKWFTAREANKILSLTGHIFWQEESYDRLVRNDREFNKILRYIELNPVEAGLVSDPSSYPWSSFGRLKAGQRAASPPYLES